MLTCCCSATESNKSILSIDLSFSIGNIELLLILGISWGDSVLKSDFAEQQRSNPVLWSWQFVYSANNRWFYDLTPQNGNQQNLILTLDILLFSLNLELTHHENHEAYFYHSMKIHDLIKDHDLWIKIPSKSTTFCNKIRWKSMIFVSFLPFQANSNVFVLFF